MKTGRYYNGLYQFPSAFDEVIEKLYEALVMHPQSTEFLQPDVFNTDEERKQQILYHLDKTISDKEKSDLAKEFAQALLDFRDTWV